MTAISAFPRRAALVAAISLLAMTVLGPFGFLTVQGHLDAGPTPENIAAIGAGGTFTWAIVAFSVVALLDIAAAWGLFVVFREADARLSLVSAILRAVYGVALAALLLHLMQASSLAAEGAAASLQSIASFLRGWLIALGVFGLHLIVLGAVGFKQSNLHNVIAVLIVIAGLGYVIDALGTLLIPGYALNIAAFLFIGELVLMVWLFWRAARG